MSQWLPSASPEGLAARADLLQALRRFFYDRGVMEVATPLLSQGTVPDPGIDVFQLQGEGDEPDRYLQTSPESAMKRLLAAGSGDIFQICKAFRQGEAGRHHNPEFTLLEWYRVGWNHAALMREVAELLGTVLNLDGWQVWPYRALFVELLGVDPPDWLRAGGSRPRCGTRSTHEPLCRARDQRLGAGVHHRLSNVAGRYGTVQPHW